MVAYLLSVVGEDETGAVIKEDTYTVITQLVTKAVFVGVVHPFTDPVDRN